jgi:hypothetical protein
MATAAPRREVAVVLARQRIVMTVEDREHGPNLA